MHHCLDGSHTSKVDRFVFNRFPDAVGALALAFAGQQEHADADDGVEGRRRPRDAVRGAETHASVRREPVRQVRPGVLQRVAEHLEADEHCCR